MSNGRKKISEINNAVRARAYKIYGYNIYAWRLIDINYFKIEIKYCPRAAMIQS